MTAICFPPFCCARRIFADFSVGRGIFKNLGLGEAAKRGVGIGGYGQPYADIPDMNSFPAAFSVNGWAKIPSGMIIQWGQAEIIAQDQIISLPIAFPKINLQVISTDSGGAAFSVGVSQYSNDRLQFRIDTSRYSNGIAVVCRYMAIGY